MSLPDLYPKEAPRIILQSIYNMGGFPLPEIELNKINVEADMETTEKFLK